MTAARAEMRRRLIAAAERDPRIVGLVNDGSLSAGRGDEWSDIDVSVFVRDEDFAAFASEWTAWAAQFGELLLAYISHVGHPWTVYAAEPVPLRVDFDLHRASTVDEVRGWPASPLSVEAMLWYDGAGGRLRDAVAALVGRSLRPSDPRAAFEQQCGDLWYELLYTLGKLQRGQHWVARQAYHCRVLEPLLMLLRIEADAGALDRWQANPAALDVETALPAERLARLDGCIPAGDEDGLRLALHAAALLGREVCQSIATQHGWPWPQQLAEQTVRLLASTAPA